MDEKIFALDEATKMKTYSDSFLYNHSGKNGENLMKEHDKLLINYIIKSERLDKRSPQFTGVLEDVKRNQTSSIIYTILMMDNVHLCVNSQEMPPVFKVIDAVDLKTDRKPAIFIDVTKLIVENNGYYTCKNITKLVAYLFSAMIYLAYRKDTAKVTSNSAIIISGTECYANMFSAVLDYLRIVGYPENKNKIAYFICLFFLVHIIGKDLDTYTKGIAAKVAKIPTNSISAFDLYIEDGMFDNIDVFVTTIADTFRLKNLTTEVFITKWIFLFGNGTQYATELFTSFATILGYTFCSAYIVNQKQIEKACGTSMVKFCNAYIMIGNDLFDRRAFMTEAELREYEVHDSNAQMLAESIRLGKSNIKPENLSFVKEDFAEKDAITKKIEDNLEYYTKLFDGQEKMESVFETAIKKALVAMDSTASGKEDFLYEDGVLETLVKTGVKYFGEDTKAEIKNYFIRRISSYNETMSDRRDENQESAKRYGKSINELRKCVNLM